jgi:hypothetical protein
MVRKLAAVFLLSLLTVAFLATTVAFSADKQLKTFKNRASVPARFAPVFSVPGLTGYEHTDPAPPPQKSSLRGSGSVRGPVNTIGSTTYDYQHNCTMGRLAEHRTGYSNPYTPYGIFIAFDWMSQAGAVLGEGRGVGFQAYEITECDYVFEAGGIRIEPDYAGYVTMDAHNIDPANSWAIPGAHILAGTAWRASSLWDLTIGGPYFGVFSDDSPLDKFGWWQNSGTGPGNENIWPKIDWDIDGAEQIVHMVTTESGGDAGDPQNHSYYRRVGGYGTGIGVWSNQRLIDTAMNINVTVSSSPVSDKVAIVWNAPTDYWRAEGTTLEFNNQYENDVWFAIATDNGAGWVSVGPGPSIGSTVDLGLGGGYDRFVGGNLTTYDSLDDHKAYCDMSSLWYIDGVGDDWLQIAWGCRRWGVDDPASITLYRRQGAVFHWNQKTDSIRTVVKAWWDSGGACYGHAWGTDAAKITISQCDGRLYLSYTQFGTANNPCDYYDAVSTVISGYVYMTVFDPIYDAWDRPQRVTSTTISPTGCTPGDMDNTFDCNNEYWASMARYGRIDTCLYNPDSNVLDVVYINDYAPGGVVQPESGVWTINDVNWVAYGCREAVPEPGYADDAGPGYGLCVGEPILVVGTSDATSVLLTLENSGIEDNDYSIAHSVDSSNGASNGANTNMVVTPTSGTIPGKGGTEEIDIDITTSNENEFTTVYATITVTHEAGESPPTDRVIPVCITVTDYYEPLDYVTLATTCKQLRVYNNGQMANNASNETLDFIDDPDDCAFVYLYDASPLICRDVGGEKKCWHTVYDNNYAGEKALRQVTPVTVNTDNPDYTMAYAEFVTGDSAIGLFVEYFVATDENYCGFVIQKLKFWNKTEATLNGVAVGEALDWDIPNFDHGSNNDYGYDPDRKLMYQYCCTQDPCDSLLPCERFGGIAPPLNKSFKNSMVLKNAVYVYTTGPFGEDAPLPSDTMYGLMTGNDGPTVATLDSCEDLFTLVTFDVYDLDPADTQCVVKILTTSKNDPGGAQLKLNVGDAHFWVAADSAREAAVTCPSSFVCDCMPGDANGDGSINVGDAVYLISFVFKGGPAPTPYATCSGDANCDCAANVGDAVFIIAYVFKGGPAPCLCDEWEVNCGPGLY